MVKKGLHGRWVDSEQLAAYIDGFRVVSEAVDYELDSFLFFCYVW